MKHHIDRKTLAGYLCVLLSLVLLQGTALADLADSTFGAGTKNLISDLFKYLVVISPLTGGAFSVYFVIRKGMADEQEGKMWANRIKTAIACGVGGCLVSGIIAVITSYYV